MFLVLWALELSTTTGQFKAHTMLKEVEDVRKEDSYAICDHCWPFGGWGARCFDESSSQALKYVSAEHTWPTRPLHADDPCSGGSGTRKGG